MYSMKDALSQVKVEVEKVYTANVRTEKMLESFTGYLDMIEVGPLSFHLHTLFTILACTGSNK